MSEIGGGAGCCTENLNNLNKKNKRIAFLY